MVYELVIVGGGNMGAALLGGLVSSGALAGDDIAIVELDAGRRRALGEKFPGISVVAEVPDCRSAVIAVKPQHVGSAVEAVTGHGAASVLSIAAGVTASAIAAAAIGCPAIVRAMPNTPALVGAAVTAIAAGPNADDSSMEWAERMLTGVGLVVRVEEDQIDAVTGLTGSGPAYVFLVAEALIAAGIDNGLPLQLVEPMVAQLLVGSARLLSERGDPAALRVAVTSPGGTTAAGLQVLNNSGLVEMFVAAVTAATERGRQIGRGLD